MKFVKFEEAKLSNIDGTFLKDYISDILAVYSPTAETAVYFSNMVVSRYSESYIDVTNPEKKDDNFTITLLKDYNFSNVSITAKAPNAYAVDFLNAFGRITGRYRELFKATELIAKNINDNLNIVNIDLNETQTRTDNLHATQNGSRETENEFDPINTNISQLSGKTTEIYNNLKTDNTGTQTNTTTGTRKTWDGRTFEKAINDNLEVSTQLQRYMDALGALFVPAANLDEDLICYSQTDEGEGGGGGNLPDPSNHYNDFLVTNGAGTGYDLRKITADDLPEGVSGIKTADELLPLLEGSETVVVDLNEAGNAVEIHIDAETVQKIDNSLQLPAAKPPATVLTAINPNGAQTSLTVGNGLKIENGTISAEGGGASGGLDIYVHECIFSARPTIKYIFIMAGFQVPLTSFQGGNLLGIFNDVSFSDRLLKTYRVDSGRTTSGAGIWIDVSVYNDAMNGSVYFDTVRNIDTSPMPMGTQCNSDTVTKLTLY